MTLSEKKKRLQNLKDCFARRGRMDSQYEQKERAAINNLELEIKREERENVTS